MKNTIVYVHGKGGSAEEAEHYKSLFSHCKIIGFDYKAQNPWEAKEEFLQFFKEYRKQSENLLLVANSIGAFCMASRII